MNSNFKLWLDESTSFLEHINYNHYGPGPKGGQFAPSNGGNSSSITRRKEKIDTIDSKINSTKNQKKLARAAKNEARLIKAERKAKRAMKKQLKGKELNSHDLAKLQKVQRLKEKINKDTQKNAKLEAKKAKLEYKNQKETIELPSGSDGDMFSLRKDRHKCKSIQGDAMVEIFGNEIAMFGKSSTKNFFIEERSKNGVHLLKSYPTEIAFDKIGLGSTIDRKKLKAYDKVAMSKETRKAVLAGREFVAESFPVKEGNNEWIRSANYSPSRIGFKDSSTGEPTIDYVYYTDRSSKKTVEVTFENGKPKEGRRF